MHTFAATLLTMLAIARAEADEPPREWGKIHIGGVLTSDYRFSGVSASDRDPAIQGYAHLAAHNGWFVGIWSSSVDFNDLNNTSVEWDTYAGRELALGNTTINLQAMYSAFDDDEPGPTYDFLQAKVRVVQPLGRISFTASGAWSPAGSYGAGRTWQLFSEARYNLANWLSFSVGAGRTLRQRRLDRSYWNVGFSARWQRYSLGVRYVDTSHDFAECGFVDWCGSALVGEIGMNFMSIPLNEHHHR